MELFFYSARGKQIPILATMDCSWYPPLLSPVHQVQKPHSQKLHASSEGLQLKQHLSQDHRGGWSAPSPAEIQENRTRRPEHVNCRSIVQQFPSMHKYGDWDQVEQIEMAQKTSMQTLIVSLVQKFPSRFMHAPGRLQQSHHTTYH